MWNRKWIGSNRAKAKSNVNETNDNWRQCQNKFANQRKNNVPVATENIAKLSLLSASI